LRRHIPVCGGNSNAGYRRADVRADLSPRPNHYRTNFDELVNTDTSHSSGICKVAAKQFARYI
jgi:hypothetical protein